MTHRVLQVHLSVYKLNLPSKSITIGLLFEFRVLKTRTAVPAGEVSVVAGAVGVVDSGAVVVDNSGAGVVPTHSNPSHGHPAAQFSLKRP